MMIRLKMFAILRDRSGVTETEIEVADGAIVAAAIEEAGKRYPAIANLLPKAAAAVNLAYVERSAMLREGDELALIPPVSGGWR
jgi:molybdopterin converting factor subunit 1